MKIEKIKPIPKYIINLINRADKKDYPSLDGHTRYYAYLTKNDGELVKVTVAVRHRYKKWYCKQCAVHGIHSEKCFVKDMAFYFIGGYITGWFSEGLTKYPKWYEDPDWDLADDKYFDPFAPVVNIEYALKFKKYKYSAVNLFHHTRILQYLRLYEKYPQLEYLTKIGLGKFYDSTQILNKTTDKAFCKWLIKNRDILKNKYFYIDVILRAYRTGRDLNELQFLKKAKLAFIHDNGRDNLKGLFKGKDLEQLLLYIAKHKTTLATYKDYYTACTKLELDMTEDKNRFPHDFKRWHNIRIDQYNTKKAELDAAKRKELYLQFASVAEKYLSLEKQNGQEYVAIIAHSPAELMREGDILHHCVGHMNYEQKFVREEGLIFFIRTKERPNVPYVTVEYSPKTQNILQLHGDNNCMPDEATTHFIKDIWLPYANKNIKQIAV